MGRGPLHCQPLSSNGQGGQSPGNLESGSLDGLTCIPQRIHCTATPDTNRDENELDRIAIDTFLDTIADIALAVARRRQQVEP